MNIDCFINELSQYLQEANLKLNLEKSSILCKNPKEIKTKSGIKKTSKPQRLIGYPVDINGINWVAFLEVKKQKLAAALSFARNFGFFHHGLPVHLKMKILATFLIPLIDYGLGQIDPNDPSIKNVSKAIERLYLKALKISCDIPFWTSSSLLYSMFRGYTFKQRWEYFYYRNRLNYDLFCQKQHSLRPFHLQVPRFKYKMNDCGKLIKILFYPVGHLKGLRKCPICNSRNKLTPNHLIKCAMTKYGEDISPVINSVIQIQKLTLKHRLILLISLIMNQIQ
eukprot:NODE_552_length_6155_cov_0.827774.p2 type:complete len:281 gc:universal NODE_552_length_6155_cov_0.827774:2248-1406(-)